MRRVAIFAGSETVMSDMPRLGDDIHGWGHALGREHLDTMLVDRAAAMGARVFQPYTATEIRSCGDSYECVITAGDTRTLSARVVVGAHGSWDHNGLRTQPTRRPAGPSDLFGFKARFGPARRRAFAGRRCRSAHFPGYAASAAFRRRPRQPVMLHQARLAGAMPARGSGVAGRRRRADAHHAALCGRARRTV